MEVCLFDSHKFEREIFSDVNKGFQHKLTFLEPRLTPQTAILANGFPVVCAFANDQLNEKTLTQLSNQGTKLIALRSAGYNHVDLKAAALLGLKVVRVPAYSPYSVAEHAVALVLALNRKTHRAYMRVREGNFSLEGLIGFDLHGKSVGIIGTGKIGKVAARIFGGFGCRVFAYDQTKDSDLEKQGVQYISLEKLYAESDIISLHVPLTKETRHLIDEKALNQMKKGVILINTGRGALIDTKALIQSLKTGHLGAAGLDVYEEEENFFFKDMSDQVIQDDALVRLMTFPNVLITSHQGFLTQEALRNIAATTLQNIRDYEKGETLKNLVSVTT